MAKTYYEHIEHYYVPLCNVTGTFAKKEEEKVSAQAIEIWTTLAEEEFDRMQNGQDIKGYIDKGQGHLVGLLLECIQNVMLEDEDQEDDEWGVALSSGCCLKAVATVIKNDVIPPVLAFVEKNIQA